MAGCPSGCIPEFLSPTGLKRSEKIWKIKAKNNNLPPPSPPNRSHQRSFAVVGCNGCAGCAFAASHYCLGSRSGEGGQFTGRSGKARQLFKKTLTCPESRIRIGLPKEKNRGERSRLHWDSNLVHQINSTIVQYRCNPVGVPVYVDWALYRFCWASRWCSSQIRRSGDRILRWWNQMVPSSITEWSVYVCSDARTRNSRSD